MKSIRIHNKKWVFVCLLFMLCLKVFPVKAAKYDEKQKHQVIFALDCSYSMTEDRWQEAVDSVAAIMAMLPSNYETAILAYNEKIVLCTDFKQSLSSKLNELEKVERKGYTNTGLAVETALGQFDADLPGEKRIVIISDGEISMKGGTETENAILLYGDAVRNALEKKVKIDILLFATQEVEDQISQGTQETKGILFEKTKEKSTKEFLEAYLFDELALERIMLGISDAAHNTLTVSLKDSAAECAKVLLIAENDIEDLQIFCQCEEIEIIQGEKIAVINLNQLLEEEINLQYMLAEKGKITAYLIKEYHLSVETSAVYEEEYSQHMIRISITNAEGKSILADQDICEKIDIYINEKRSDYVVEQGMAVIPYPVEEAQEITVRIDFEGLKSLIFCGETERKLLLEPQYPEPEEKDDMRYFWLYVVVASVCFIFILLILLLFRAKKKTESSMENTQKVQSTGEILKYDFSGKIVVYVLKSEDEKDMPPASINLYKREGKEPFSFAWVKDKCRIETELSDADKIIFSGGKNNTLCIRNNGDAALFYGKDILLRSKKYTLNYDEKLLMLFNQGKVEIEIHYKNIKPSERER